MPTRNTAATATGEFRQSIFRFSRTEVRGCGEAEVDSAVGTSARQ